MINANSPVKVIINVVLRHQSLLYFNTSNNNMLFISIVGLSLFYLISIKQSFFMAFYFQIKG